MAQPRIILSLIVILMVAYQAGHLVSTELGINIIKSSYEVYISSMGLITQTKDENSEAAPVSHVGSARRVRWALAQ